MGETPAAALKAAMERQAAVRDAAKAIAAETAAKVQAEREAAAAARGNGGT